MENQDQNKSIQDILNTHGPNGGFSESKIRRSRDFRFYGVTQSRTGSPERSLSLKLIKSSMEQLVIPYHDFGSPISYDGKGTIELTASTIHITIEGKGLGKLLDYLAEHRLMWIKEPENTADTFNSGGDEDDIVITSIEVRSVH